MHVFGGVGGRQLPVTPKLFWAVVLSVMKRKANDPSSQKIHVQMKICKGLNYWNPTMHLWSIIIIIIKIRTIDILIYLMRPINIYISWSYQNWYVCLCTLGRTMIRTNNFHACLNKRYITVGNYTMIRTFPLIITQNRPCTSIWSLLHVLNCMGNPYRSKSIFIGIYKCKNIILFNY